MEDQGKGGSCAASTEQGLQLRTHLAGALLDGAAGRSSSAAVTGASAPVHDRGRTDELHCQRATTWRRSCRGWRACTLEVCVEKSNSQMAGCGVCVDGVDGLDVDNRTKRIHQQLVFPLGRSDTFIMFVRRTQ